MKQTLFFPPSCVASSFGEKVGLGSQTLGSWAFCLGKVDSSGALDKGGREREKAGREYFLQHFSLCSLRIYSVEPHSSSAASCPVGSDRALWAASHSVLIWNSHWDLRVLILKVPSPFEAHAHCTSAAC